MSFGVSLVLSSVLTIAKIVLIELKRLLEIKGMEESINTIYIVLFEKRKNLTVSFPERTSSEKFVLFSNKPTYNARASSWALPLLQ